MTVWLMIIAVIMLNHCSLNSSEWIKCLFWTIYFWLFWQKSQANHLVLFEFLLILKENVLKVVKSEDKFQNGVIDFSRTSLMTENKFVCKMLNSKTIKKKWELRLSISYLHCCYNLSNGVFFCFFLAPFDTQSMFMYEILFKKLNLNSTIAREKFIGGNHYSRTIWRLGTMLWTIEFWNFWGGLNTPLTPNATRPDLINLQSYWIKSIKKLEARLKL